MSVNKEIGRMGWRIYSYIRFFRPQPAIMGWFSHHNLGDDAAEICFNRFFDNKLAVITPQTYRRIPSNLKLLICGGGGWLNRDAPAHFLKYIKRVKNRSFPCLFLSGGINRDYTDNNYRSNYPVFKEFISHFDYVAVRDEMSKRLLEDLEVKNVKIIPDVVLSLTDGGHTSDPSQKQGLKTVGVVLATHNATVKTNFSRIYPFLLELCDLMVRKGYKVAFIPFQVDRRSSKDKAVDETIPAKKLRQDLNDKENIEVIEKMMTAGETLAYIKHKVSIVVSMRLHGNVMAAAAGVPFISLSYNDKHAGFLEMMGMPERDIPLNSDVLSANKAMNLLEVVEQDYGGAVSRIESRAEQLRQQTYEQVQEVRRRYFS